MPIQFHPEAGAVLVCDYSGFVTPEMVKRRLCVVITPRLRRRTGLTTVVPLSTTPPNPICDYHREVIFARPLPKPWGDERRWAKCDMFSTVGYHRLAPIGVGRAADGRRKYIYPRVDEAQLMDIRRGVLCALALQKLTKYL